MWDDIPTLVQTDPHQQFAEVLLWLQPYQHVSPSCLILSAQAKSL